MQLSRQSHCGLPIVASGFAPTEVQTKSDYESLTRSNWAPALFKDGYRNLESFVSISALCFDVDNCPGDPQCSLSDFARAWAGTRYIIATSKSHGKEKSGGKKRGTMPPADRFHVIFPLYNPIIDPSDARDALKKIAAAHPYFDANATDAARFFFGHPGTIVTMAQGDYINIDYYLQNEPRATAPAPAELPGALLVRAGLGTGFEDVRIDESAPIFSAPDSRARVLDALHETAKRGGFDDRAAWVKLAMALKAESYSVADFIALSWPDSEAEARVVWDTAKPSRVSGGSLIHFARESSPTLFVHGSDAGTARAAELHAARAAAVIKEIPPAIVAPSPGGPYQYGTLSGPLVDIASLSAYHVSKNGTIVKSAMLLQELARLDPAIATCVRYDEGSGEIIYSPIFRSLDELKTRLHYRFSEYGIELSRDERTLIVDEILMRKENTFNSILDFYHASAERHDSAHASGAGNPFDELMTYFYFQEVGNEDPMICPEHNEKTLAAYREALHLFFLRQATRIHIAFERPGIQIIPHDIVPIFRGRQGIGKSRFCHWLAGDPRFFCDLGATSVQIGDANLIRKLSGRLVGELGELSSLKKGDVDIVKAFISETVDEYTPKFKEGIKKCVRTCAFFGSTNSDKFLKDRTGNRRFYPMWLHHIDPELFDNQDLCARLWGYYYREAVKLVQRGDIGALFEQESGETFAAIRSGAVEYGTVAEYIRPAIDELERHNINTRKQNQQLYKLDIVDILDKLDNSLVKDYTANIVAAILAEYGYVRRKIKTDKRNAWGYAIARDDKRLIERMADSRETEPVTE